MDAETIKEINRKALQAAKEAQRVSGALVTSATEQQPMVYLLAVALSVVVYYLLQQYKPSFVMVANANGQMNFDTTRAVVAAVVAGVLVVVVHALMNRQ